MTANSIKSSKAFSVFIVSANNRIVPLETAIDHNDPVAERESYTAEKCLDKSTEAGIYYLLR